ncbi:putative ATP-dependent RNA helicase DDX11 [Zancudomyces culisetae]|uniref:ATP-dependent DNA helicase CHL1 n=1 Tax=Zancudomyces culisetae TaxID=1213189 RepID=A0A1R1PLZ8_ZANCU|nr:putative ATP-dependent RNA helicase DDX11 [Zancudomyces culisetae]|eukprot:OMH82001.1 putative ATP-dependent RNA helicase DDX11 [Zancudomyces culisetae]
MKEYLPEDGSLEIPDSGEKYHFPFEPYHVQLGFMKNVFEVCENGKFGIFQSPTGKEPSWIMKQKREKRDRERKEEYKKQLEKYEKWVKKIRELEMAECKNSRKLLFVSRQANIKSKNDTGLQHEENNTGENENEVLEDYNSDPEVDAGSKDKDVKLWLKSYNSGAIDKGFETSSDEDDDYFSGKGRGKGVMFPTEPDTRQVTFIVIYASRTHSQLSQTLKEFKKTRFWTEDVMKAVTVGSRQQLCINSKVTSSCTTVGQINERCIDLQKSTTPKARRCPYLTKEHTPMLDFAAKCRSDVLDIEDLVVVGKSMDVCPYYGVRRALSGSQLIAVPYNLLLVKESREALGLNIENTIVVIDEAHNLIESIANAYGSTLKWEICKRAHDLVKMYFDKYWKRLKGQNIVYIRQLITLLKMIDKYFATNAKVLQQSRNAYNEKTNDTTVNTPSGVRSAKGSNVNVHVMNTNELLTQLRIENINLPKLVRFLQISQLSRKLSMFNDRIESMKQEAEASKIQNSNSNKRARTESCKKNISGAELERSQTRNIENQGYRLESAISPMAALSAVESFMSCLGISNSNAGRVFLTLSVNEVADGQLSFEGELKYVLMDPSDSFFDIITLPRAVILAGGTMSPMDDVVVQLGLNATEPSQETTGLTNRHSSTDPSSKATTHALKVDSIQKRKPVHIFECGHVVPSSSISMNIIGYGTGSSELVLNFSNQKNSKLLYVAELGESLFRVIDPIPGGVVAFFPSYSFLNNAVANWSNSGIINKISLKKKVFIEPKISNSRTMPTTDGGNFSYTAPHENKRVGKPKMASGNVQGVLASYGSAVRRNNGAILFAVVGGNMSEGINFSDELARAVIMLGMPFPNLGSPELAEKIKHYQNNQSSGLFKNTRAIPTQTARQGYIDNSPGEFKMDSMGLSYYENMCMRAVNQSIGKVNNSFSF